MVLNFWLIFIVIDDVVSTQDLLALFGDDNDDMIDSYPRVKRPSRAE